LVARAAKLSLKQKRLLATALADARGRTSARLALTVVYVSDKYPLYSLVYGALAGIAVLGALALGWPNLPLRDGFYAAVGATIVVTALFDIMPLRLKFIPRHAKFWECWELAHRSFAARILAQNDRKTGILIFVSLGERYIEVVTDRDVDRHIPQSVWDALIKDFTTAAKRRRIGEGLIAAVENATKVLEQHYPAQRS
jgi:putative membrane protein